MTTWRNLLLHKAEYMTLVASFMVYVHNPLYDSDVKQGQYFTS